MISSQIKSSTSKKEKNILSKISTHFVVVFQFPGIKVNCFYLQIVKFL